MSDKEKEQNATEKNWLDEATDIKFDITYLGIENANPVKWQCKILQADEEKQIRQKHFAQSEEKQAETRHAYNVEMLSRIATAPPVGLPGFDKILEENSNDLQKAIYAALIKPTPARIKLADDSLNYYTTINQPAEFFR